MIKFINKEGKQVLEMNDNGNLNILSEELKDLETKVVTEEVTDNE